MCPHRTEQKWGLQYRIYAIVPEEDEAGGFPGRLPRWTLNHKGQTLWKKKQKNQKKQRTAIYRTTEIMPFPIYLFFSITYPSM